MKQSIIFVLITFSISAFAQDSTQTSKLDTIIANQAAIMEMQKKIYEETRYESPISKYNYGIELNLFRFFYNIQSEMFSISGTFSSFDFCRSGELAFPFYYQKNRASQSPVTLFNFDVTFRYFIGKYQQGMYFSVGTRFTYIKAMEGEDFNLFGVKGGNISTSKRIGPYVGIGYRYFAEKGFYWGFSIIYGRYLNKPIYYKDVHFDDTKEVIDIELLKFGFAF